MLKGVLAGQRLIAESFCLDMRLSKLLVPHLRKLDSPTSVDLLVAHGFIHKTGSGVYDMLPLGLRVQRKIEAIVRRHLAAIDSQELALSSLVDPKLWQKSGRLGPDRDGEFMFSDKHLLAPTGEEQVTTLVGSTSYRQLPLSVYQITRKYRNELRAKSGLLRTREFTMKDAYTFDVDHDGALASYQLFQNAYKDIFRDIGVPVVAAQADSGNMGGNLSHEYHLLSALGEDTVLVCSSCGSAKNKEVGDNDETNCSSCGGELKSHAGIEVGHTFYLGTRYTDPLGSLVTQKSGATTAMEMGCYGLGITRLVGAIADALRTSRGLYWPLAVAPAQVCVIGTDVEQNIDVAKGLANLGFDTVAEDRTTQLGHALRAGREAGWPVLVILGKKYHSEGLFEIETPRGTVFSSKKQLKRVLEMAMRVRTAQEAS